MISVPYHSILIVIGSAVHQDTLMRLSSREISIVAEIDLSGCAGERVA